MNVHLYSTNRLLLLHTAVFTYQFSMSKWDGISISNRSPLITILLQIKNLKFLPNV